MVQTANIMLDKHLREQAGAALARELEVRCEGGALTGVVKGGAYWRARQPAAPMRNVELCNALPRARRSGARAANTR